jgi:hypothetical protein
MGLPPQPGSAVCGRAQSQCQTESRYQTGRPVAQRVRVPYQQTVDAMVVVVVVVLLVAVVVRSNGCGCSHLDRNL